jgi:hypothetical protein
MIANNECLGGTRHCSFEVVAVVRDSVTIRDLDLGVSDSGDESIQCPGSGQLPRCAASDKRPLWKDGGSL